MQISLNGKPYSLEKSTSISRLAEILELEPTQFAIEKNGEIIPRSLYGSEMLDEGDVVEIVSFIGGG